jgi:hypothetical protein
MKNIITDDLLRNIGRVSIKEGPRLSLIRVSKYAKAKKPKETETSQVPAADGNK